jgi:hypothetical protein
MQANRETLAKTSPTLLCPKLTLVVFEFHNMRPKEPFRHQSGRALFDTESLEERAVVAAVVVP